MTNLPLLLLLLAAALVSVNGDTRLKSPALAFNNIAADSGLGLKLLSKARRLEEEGEEGEEDKEEEEEGESNEEEGEEEQQSNDEEEGEEEEEDADDNNNAQEVSWVAGYSLKFQGCHHIQQWNEDADDEEDVRIETKRLVRFRLCPSSSCDESKAAGCKSGYGDYILDLTTYLTYYYEAQQNQNGNDDNALKDYLECAQIDGGNDDDGGGDNAYYVGPYCAEQGGAIHLGVFSDDSCTTPAEVSYTSLTGSSLPYESESMIGSECMSCAEGNNGNDNDADNTLEQCEAIYDYAGKCETNLPSGTVDEKNEGACNYIEGIKIVRNDGIAISKRARPAPAVTAFIVLFALMFCAMAFYVWYLRMRLGVKSNSLL